MAYFISASLFPSPITPYTGLFVSHRLNALRNYLPNNTPFFIVSPTPYFPFKNAYFKHYSIYAQKPCDIIHYQGFEIAYPRYLQLPLTQSRFSGYFTHLSIKKHFDYFVKNHGLPKTLIAEYGFPDVLAIYELAKRHKIPYVVTLRGSDVSYFMQIPAIRPKMTEALKNAKAIIAVSGTMKHELHTMFSIPLDAITVIGNGVDSTVFKQTSCNIRDMYDIQTPHIICSVGGLIKRKNHALAISAMPFLPNHSLLIVGTGEEYDSLNTQIQSLNLGGRVKLLGAKPQETLAEIYSNSDLFLLCSLSEGRPNVVLEALACGTPVLTSAVQGVNELITKNYYGTILDMTAIAPQNLADNIARITQTPHDKAVIQKHGSGFSWGESAKAYGDIIIS